MRKSVCKLLFGHKYKLEYLNETCYMVSKCQRCGHNKDDTYLTRHQFYYWKYETPNSCTKAAVCIRCNQKETKIEHDFRYKACVRCGVINPNTCKHEWNSVNISEQVPDGQYECYRCRKCGEYKWL